ncbi:asparagine synthase-related protein [Candidatus Chloroploca sp. Khr17]|uniref:asparagine synthase-related protein n=1 Tax=Candidatus Chloroploca sp. Khr17 TaxID=2496869 RepID=UPI00101CF1C4|nr:asparagine synthase-related protein [Candidatus Chloroploca sp. Khr17]
MSGIFGSLSASALPEKLAAMDAALAHWGPDGGGLWHDAHCGLGQRLLFNTPEAVYERLPRWVADARLAITAEARIDNRDELCDYFAIPPTDRPTTPDSDLILRAYLKWGEECPDHLLGDWSFAVWHPDERKLFLARDHHGNTSLVYWQQGEQFAFASAPQALYAIGAPRRLNELYLAQVLISWPAYHGPQTIDLDIQRLPPAHAMTVMPQGTRVWRYWRLEETPELRLPSRDDYVQGFLEIYDRAVRDRLRSYRPVGVTLSGGLDSGSVTALAARALGEQGKRLTAFTTVPIYDTSQTVGPQGFGDETLFAAATAAHWANVDHILLDSAAVTPMQGIRRTLAVMPEPAHAASNYFWIADLLDQAQALGLGVLLTGQGGNATVSWTGAPELRSHLAAFRNGGMKEGIRRILPLWALRPLMQWRARSQDWAGAAIRPDFARRMDLSQRRIAAMGKDIDLPEIWRSPRDKRCGIIQPGADRVGDLWARQGAAAGLEVRDPTLDKRVMAYTIAVPDPIFDSPDGGDRWMMRASMAGLLPDKVRLNRKRGRQSADLAGRLRASAGEVADALAAVNAAPANSYVDVVKMRRAWADVQREATALTTHRAGTILLRGLLAGLFLNRE